jgi:alkanesulfonate monooxygenase SsuD/methylene tetrahydromethanopterin reductase-like flavin-dependent oxidoreductase (luciferase family)
MVRILRMLACLAVPLLTACSPEPPVLLPASQSASAAGMAGAMAGAWSSADPFDPDVQEAARFAVQTFAVQGQRRLLFKDVIQARQQVVAGLNLELHVQVSEDGAKRSARVTVWRKPDGRYSLTEWDWQR